MGVSKNRGTPKWMVYNGKPYEQMDDLGVPLFSETSVHIYIYKYIYIYTYIWERWGEMIQDHCKILVN